MAQVKVGDRVKIVDREPTNADAKSGLYYGYFSNLVGKVERDYDDKTVCLDVELDSLPEDVRVRHQEMQTAARDKWINGLPQEQRNRLSEHDKQFKMSYKVLVASADVEPAKGSGPRGGSKNPAKASASAPPADSAAKPKTAAKDSSAPSAKAEPSPAVEKPESPTKVSKEEPSQRLTEKDLEAREQAYMESLQKKQGGPG